MQKVDGKSVPPLWEIPRTETPTQDDYCDIANCASIDLDCKECIFDSKRCPKEIFEKWLEGQGEEETDVV